MPRTWHQDRRKLVGSLAYSSLAVLAAGCSGGSVRVTLNSSRAYRRGFSPNPPRFDTQSVLQGIDIWSQRAELAIIHEELPWADLLNGLSRSEEAPQLRAAGASITDPAVRQPYRDYVLAVARKLAPEYMGLAAETNLIRAVAPAAPYAAVVQAANDAAADLKATNAAPIPFVSVLVEAAWGQFAAGGAFVGVDQDFADFPFMQSLGFSSYPYFVFAKPEDLPADYYSRVVGGRNIPVMVVEGGWTSASVGNVMSSPDLQGRYITHHADLLDSVDARSLLQLGFADLDLASFPPPVPANLPLFAQIGVADSHFAAKPALTKWDELFARSLTG